MVGGSSTDIEAAAPAGIALRFLSAASATSVPTSAPACSERSHLTSIRSQKAWTGSLWGAPMSRTEAKKPPKPPVLVTKIKDERGTKK